MSKIMRIKRSYCIHLINTFLSGTHFFSLKRILLIWAGIACGSGTCIVGPLYLGNVAKVSFGNNVWVGRNFSVNGNGTVYIDNNIDIAPDVSFITGSHEIGDSTRRAGAGASYTITIKDGSWIGARATILGDTTINKGSVIAAGAVVNKSVGPNAVYGGVPAKMIRSLDIEK